MALYIVDTPNPEYAFPYISIDEDARVLLLHDALFIDKEKLAGREIYVIDKEVESRGLSDLLPDTVNLVSYDEAVDLIMAHKVINF
ncbi:MAG: DsrH/TusB family sulfur metabolism protein [Candidatus Xenobiia bacterium LiM19]